MSLLRSDVLVLRHDEGLRRDSMQAPEDVAVMQRLRALGWGVKRIARELGVSKNTVRRHLHAGRWMPYRQPMRDRRLAGLEGWLKECFYQHRGNAEVVRQELERVHSIMVSRRTVERAVAGWRQDLRAEALATVRFETPPGQQLQVDFGAATVMVAAERVKVHLFVATLGYSRRHFVAIFRHERQSAWLEGLERAFQHFAGVPEEVLLDNAKALVIYHNAETREVVFNERFRAFAAYWGFRARACAPYRARTKGKDERAVGYVKHNALAGREFASWEALEAHLAWWMRAVADVRVHGTLGEQPTERFARAEAAALRPLNGRVPFQAIREVVRRVHSDACVEIATNRYSVPWRLIGREVTVLVAEGQVRVFYGTEEVARHRRCLGQRQRQVEREHLAGIIGGAEPAPITPHPEALPKSEPALLRPLCEYEAVVGGGW
jgi:transposase